MTLLLAQLILYAAPPAAYPSFISVESAPELAGLLSTDHQAIATRALATGQLLVLVGRLGPEQVLEARGLMLVSSRGGRVQLEAAGRLSCGPVAVVSFAETPPIDLDGDDRPEFALVERVATRFRSSRAIAWWRFSEGGLQQAYFLEAEWRQGGRRGRRSMTLISPGVILEEWREQGVSGDFEGGRVRLEFRPTSGRFEPVPPAVALQP